MLRKKNRKYVFRQLGARTDSQWWWWSITGSQHGNLILALLCDHTREDLCHTRKTSKGDGNLILALLCDISKEFYVWKWSDNYLHPRFKERHEYEFRYTYIQAWIGCFRKEKRAWMNRSDANSNILFTIINHSWISTYIARM